MRNFIYIFICLILVSLSGCASWVVPKPGTITLENALISVGKGLVAMKNAEIEANTGKPFSTGLVTSDVEVTFNISAEGEDNTKIFVEASPPPVSPVSGKAGGSYETGATTARGNQITIRFKSILFSKTTTTPKGEVIVEGLTDPVILEKVRKVMYGLNETESKVDSGQINLPPITEYSTKIKPPTNFSDK